MLGLLVRRVAVNVPLLAIVSFIVFSLVVIVPGDPAVTLAGENPTARDIQQVRERLGLDDPFLVRYGRWAAAAVTGDLGTSLYSSQTVWGAIAARLPVSISLVFMSLAFAIVTGVALGTLARNRTLRF